jgi:hypothetical protein
MYMMSIVRIICHQMLFHIHSLTSTITEFVSGIKLASLVVLVKDANKDCERHQSTNNCQRLNSRYVITSDVQYIENHGYK